MDSTTIQHRGEQREIRNKAPVLQICTIAQVHCRSDSQGDATSDNMVHVCVRIYKLQSITFIYLATIHYIPIF